MFIESQYDQSCKRLGHGSEAVLLVSCGFFFLAMQCHSKINTGVHSFVSFAVTIVLFKCSSYLLSHALYSMTYTSRCLFYRGGDSYDSYDSSNTVQSSICGPKSPFYFTSSYNKIWIRFKSNGYKQDRGFVAGYVLYENSSRFCTSIDNNIITFDKPLFLIIRKGDILPDKKSDKLVESLI